MPNIRQSLLIGAPAETVYRAITTEEGLSGWWTPGTKTTAQVDSIARFPFGPDYFKEMRITELVPSSTVRWECVNGFDEWIGTKLSFLLEGGDKRSLSAAHPEQQGQLQQATKETQTLVVFHHDDWKSYSPMFAECSFTWGKFLTSLKLLCETGKGRPWPQQHRTDA